MTFTAVPETLARSTLGRLAPGAEVNLEPALRAGEPLGGHYVQGHVDGVAASARSSATATACASTFEAPPDCSATSSRKAPSRSRVSRSPSPHVDDGRFGVALIPYTLAETTLGTIAVGDELNLEVDVLAKYVERLIVGRIPSSG